MKSRGLSAQVAALVLIALLTTTFEVGGALRPEQSGPGALNSPSPVTTEPRIRELGSNTFQIGQVTLDKAQRTVSFPAKVRIRNEAVEYALVTNEGKGYESLLTTAARPRDIHIACLLLGLSATELRPESGKALRVPAENAVRVNVSWRDGANTRTEPLDSLVVLSSVAAEAAPARLQFSHWLYNGSMVTTNGFAAEKEGSIISLITDPTALINNPTKDREDDTIHFPNRSLLPAEKTEVRVTLVLPAMPK